MSGASAVLQRETFSTSRLLDFFSEKELVAQIGHGRRDWPLVAVKEMIDNGLDACEDAGIAPILRVEIGPEDIQVTDNGPGLAGETVERILDFGIRVSSREAYVSPCRGAQGNALKTLLAMPFVVDGESGVVEIESRGTAHRIVTRVDRIRQEPAIERRREFGVVESGTRVRLFSMVNPEDGASRFLQILLGFAFTNPHLDLTADVFGERYHWPVTDRDWKKWWPSNPSPAHWYTVESLERLASAYLANGKDPTVREFVALFRGFSGSAKQKRVLDETGFSREKLSALIREDRSLDREDLARLLDAMRAHSKPAKPEALGFIGRDHIEARVREIGAEMDSFEYDRQKGESDGIPWTIETAFCFAPELETRKIVCGVNWSPGIGNPFRELGSTGSGLDAVLAELRAGINEPVIVFLHMAAARVQYTDRGKSAVLMEAS